MELLHIDVSAGMDTQERIVKSTLMSVHLGHVRMMLHVWTGSMDISANVEQDLLVELVR